MKGHFILVKRLHAHSGWRDPSFSSLFCPKGTIFPTTHESPSRGRTDWFGLQLAVCMVCFPLNKIKSSLTGLGFRTCIHLLNIWHTKYSHEWPLLYSSVNFHVFYERLSSFFSKTELFLHPENNNQGHLSGKCGLKCLQGKEVAADLHCQKGKANPAIHFFLFAS